MINFSMYSYFFYPEIASSHPLKTLIYYKFFFYYVLIFAKLISFYKQEVVEVQSDGDVNGQ